jgi:hypothetical protein
MAILCCVAKTASAAQVNKQVSVTEHFQGCLNFTMETVYDIPESALCSGLGHLAELSLAQELQQAEVAY